MLCIKKYDEQTTTTSTDTINSLAVILNQWTTTRYYIWLHVHQYN